MTDSLQMKTINGLILEKISVTEYNYAMLLNYFSKKCVFQQLRRRFIQSMSGKREIESFFFLLESFFVWVIILLKEYIPVVLSFAAKFKLTVTHNLLETTQSNNKKYVN